MQSSGKGIAIHSNRSDLGQFNLSWSGLRKSLLGFCGKEGTMILARKALTKKRPPNISIKRTGESRQI